MLLSFIRGVSIRDRSLFVVQSAQLAGITASLDAVVMHVTAFDFMYQLVELISICF